MIERDVETGKVSLVGGLHIGDQFGLRSSLLTGTNHDRRAVRVVSTYEDTLAASKFLESNPNIGLDVFDQMTNVNMSIGVG